jgi:hypothetical protein
MLNLVIIINIAGDMFDEIVKKMPKASQLQIETQNKMKIDSMRRREQNLEYKLSKMKMKDDYESPDEY